MQIKETKICGGTLNLKLALEKLTEVLVEELEARERSGADFIQINEPIRCMLRTGCGDLLKRCYYRIGSQVSLCWCQFFLCTLCVFRVRSRCCLNTLAKTIGCICAEPGESFRGFGDDS